MRAVVVGGGGSGGLGLRRRMDRFCAAVHAARDVGGGDAVCGAKM